jgi:hypothetical protein
VVTFVHDRMKFGFIHVPKTGGMTVTNYFLNKNRDPRLLEFSSHNSNFGIHDGAGKVREVVGDDYDKYFTFAFYRNTYDWLYSLFKYISRSTAHPMHSKVKGQTFRYYIEHVAPTFLRPQRPLIAPSGKCLVTRIEPYENFAIAFQDILLELGFPKAAFKSYNVSASGKKKQSYRSAYDDHMVGKVSELYRDDIEYFGFKF